MWIEDKVNPEAKWVLKATEPAEYAEKHHASGSNVAPVNMLNLKLTKQTRSLCTWRCCTITTCWTLVGSLSRHRNTTQTRRTKQSVCRRVELGKRPRYNTTDRVLTKLTIPHLKEWGRSCANEWLLGLRKRRVPLLRWNPLDPAF